MATTPSGTSRTRRASTSARPSRRGSTAKSIPAPVVEVDDRAPAEGQRRILMVCDSDSNIGFSGRFARFARDKGVYARVAFCSGQADLTLQAAHSRGGDDDDIFIVSDWRRLFESPRILDFDAIFVMITGKDVPRFCDSLRKMAVSYGRPRPRTIGGFIGEWISGEPQIIERTGLDHFLVNRADELGLFRTIASKFGFGCEFVHIPYPFVVRHSWQRPLAKSFTYSPKSRIVFAEQVQVPRQPEERRLLFRTLAELARRHPERDILFCERELPLGGTRHRSVGNIGEFFDDLEAVAPNLKRLPGGFRENLSSADVVVSVSSTACIEALINGVPAIFLDSFTASGADKFARTGVTTDLAGLFEEREFTISDEFYAEFSDRSVWENILALALSSPRRADTSAAPVVGSLTHQYTRSITAREALFEAIGRMPRARDLTAPAQARLGFGAFENFIADLAPADLNRARLSDVTRVRADDTAPIWIEPSPEGDFPVNIDGTSFSINLGVAAADLREVQVFIRYQGRELPIRMAGGKLMPIPDVDGQFIAADFLDLAWSTGPAAVLRLRSFDPITVLRCTIVTKKRDIVVSRLAIEPSFYPSDPRVLAHVVSPGPVALTPGKDICLLVTPARWRMHAPKTELLRIVTEAGDQTMLSIAHNGSIEVSLGDPMAPEVHSFPWSASNTVMLFSTRTLTALLVNENVLVIDRPASPALLQLAGVADDMDPCFDTLELYEDEFTAGTINRLVELFTLRVFAADSDYAAKHTEIPDFRAELEARLGKPADKPKAATKPEKDKAEKPKLAKAAAEVVAVAAKAAPKVAAVVAKAAAPKAPAKVVPAKPVASAAALLPPVLQDPKGTVAPEMSRLPAFAESNAAFEKGDFEKVVEISSSALLSTPGSTRHMWLLARALNRLGRVKEAVEHTTQLVTLKPAEKLFRELHEKLTAAPAPKAVRKITIPKASPVVSKAAAPVIEKPVEVPKPAPKPVVKAAAKGAPRPSYAEADAAFARGDFKKAAEISAAALALNPDSTKLRWLLARMLNRLGQFDAGLEQTSILMQQHPGEKQYRELNDMLLARQAKQAGKAPALATAAALSPAEELAEKLRAKARGFFKA